MRARGPACLSLCLVSPGPCLRLAQDVIFSGFTAGLLSTLLLCPLWHPVCDGLRDKATCCRTGYCSRIQMNSSPSPSHEGGSDEPNNSPQPRRLTTGWMTMAEMMTFDRPSAWNATVKSLAVWKNNLESTNLPNSCFMNHEDNITTNSWFNMMLSRLIISQSHCNVVYVQLICH